MSSGILDILNRLEATSKRNEKIEILEEVKNSGSATLFKEVAYYTYNPNFDYYIIEFNTDVESHGDSRLFSSGEVLTMLTERTVTGNEAKELVEKTYADLNADDAEVFKRIVKRDLRCGAAPKTINKVFENLIYIHPYMRCSSFSKKNLKNLEFPVITQTKMDGLYCDVIFSNGMCEFVSRSGKILRMFMLNINMDQSFVLQGELLALNDSGILLERSESNGYLNRDDIDWDRVVFYAWDIIEGTCFDAKKCDFPYQQRRDRLISAVKNELSDIDWISVIESRECETPQEIIDHFKEVRAEGEEGLIIKDKKAIWKDGTSKQMVKCKVEADADVKVVGWKAGKGKFEGLIGSIECESSEGIVNFNVSGFADADRKKFTKEIDNWIESGKIITVRFNDIVQNRNDNSKFALYLPRFIKVRNDKTEADSYERIKEQLKAFTDTLEVIE